MDNPSKYNLQFVSLYSLKLDDDKSYDLLSSFLSIDRDNIEIIDAVIYDYYLINRLDKLTSYYYGDNNLLDLLLEYNEIVDPFDIPLNKIIFIPEPGALKGNYKTNEVKNILRTNNQESVSKLLASNTINKSLNGTTFNSSNPRSITNSRGNGGTSNGKIIKF